MERIKFVYEASEVESMAETAGLTVEQLLPALVKPAQALARPPISGFHVGAVGLGSDGRVFLGVNLEFPGLPLHQSVHAEQFLLANLAVHGCPRLIRFAVSDAPCGHCRQFYQELRNAPDLQVMITSDDCDGPVFKPLSSLLPSPFGPSDLLNEDTPLLLEKHDNGLSPANKTMNSSGKMCNGFCELSIEKESEMEAEALRAANESHCPYSGCPSGVALVDSGGRVWRGPYVESAAYNPSLGPVQAALVAYVAGGGGDYGGIVGGTVAEKECAPVSQEATARLLLKAVSPECDLRVLHCRSSRE